MTAIAAPGRVVATDSGAGGSAGSTSGPSPLEASKVTTPNSGTGIRPVPASRDCCSAARYRARASASPADESGRAASSLYRHRASAVA